MSETDECVWWNLMGGTGVCCGANAAEPVKIDSAECRCCNCGAFTHSHRPSDWKLKKKKAHH